MPCSAPFRLLFWCTFVLALPALGQRPSRSGIGLKGAAQWTTIQAGALSYQPMVGAAAGAYFPLWCGARFEVQPELLLSYQGAMLLHKEDDPKAIRLMYAQLPISAKLYLTNAVNLQAGAQIGRLLAATSDGDDVRDDYVPFDFGLIAGLGADLQSGLDFAVRYYSGMTPMLVDDDLFYPTNRYTQLSVGYRIARFSHQRKFRSRG